MSEFVADVPQRITRLRTALGMSQAELASRVGVPVAVMSKIVNGRAELTDDFIEACAKFLYCTPDYLREGRTELLTSGAWLRAYADASKRDEDAYRADTLVALESAIHLRLKFMDDVLPAFDSDPSDDQAIEDVAEEARAITGLADGAVATNVIRAAERLGCVVLPMPGELGRHLGLSLRVNGIPTIRVAKAPLNKDGSVPGDRQRFTVAHELGHLILHADQRPPTNAEESKRFERQAHRFAAAFLAPGDAVVEDLRELGGRVTLNTLAHLKQRWGVSIKALVMRFQQLGVIDANHARSLYKQISARGWNTGEPIPVYPERAVWLSLALKKNFGERNVDVASASTGLGSRWLATWLDWDLQPDDNVIPMVSRRSGPTEVERFGGAQITKFPIRKW